MVEKRFKEVRLFLKMTQEDLAKATNAKRTTITGYEKGLSLPHPEILGILREKYRISSDWILTGIGSMVVENQTLSKNPLIKDLESLIDNTTEPKISNLEKQMDTRFESVETELEELKKAIKNMNKTALENLTKADKTKDKSSPYGSSSNPAYDFSPEIVKLPLIENLSAGLLSETCEMRETFPVPKDLLKRKNIDGYVVAKINGNSMTEKGISSGCEVVLEMCKEPIDKEIMVVRYDGHTTLKQLHKTDEGNWELLYRDGSQAKIELKDGQWEVLAKFIAVV